MSTFHPAASSLANFSDTISTISTTRLFIYVSRSHRTNICHDITAYTLWRFQVNTESFRVLFTKEASRFWGCGQLNFAFIIERILGIKCRFPCSFGIMRLLIITRVYGRSHLPLSTNVIIKGVYNSKRIIKEQINVLL